MDNQGGGAVPLALGGQSARAEPCAAMKGLIAEGEEVGENCDTRVRKAYAGTGCVSQRRITRAKLAGRGCWLKCPAGRHHTCSTFFTLEQHPPAARLAEEEMQSWQNEPPGNRMRSMAT